MIRNQKGITLIALVITIIVLLILAGVSIAMLTGPNGLLTRANDAKSDTAKAGIKEKVELAIQSVYADTLTPDSGVTTVDADTIVAQYVVDNGANSATKTNATTLSIVDNGTTYTVTIATSGSSMKVTNVQ